LNINLPPIENDLVKLKQELNGKIFTAIIINFSYGLIAHYLEFQNEVDNLIIFYIVTAILGFLISFPLKTLAHLEYFILAFKTTYLIETAIFAYFSSQKVKPF